MRSIRLASRLALALLVGAAVSCGGSEGPSGLDGDGGDPSISMTVSPGSLTIRQGETARLTVTISRSGGFSGSVSVGVSGLPDGVVVAPEIIDAGSTSIDLGVEVAESAETGPDRMTVRASNAGVTNVSRSIPLDIRRSPDQSSVSVTR